jgi:hypothetical protein
MIDKLMEKIEAFAYVSDTDTETTTSDTNDNNVPDNFEDISKYCNGMDPNMLLATMNKQHPQTVNSQNVVSNLLTDIKSMLTATASSDVKNIIDISKDLSVKYQSLIESGTIDINDLLGGVFGLLTNPDEINEKFADVDQSTLPDPQSIMSAMSSDPNIMEAMSKMGNMSGSGQPDMGNMFDLLMPSLMGGDRDAPKTTAELDKAIDQMMKDVMEAEAKAETTNEANK